MFKKTLISLAVASSLGLTGCFDSGGTGANADPEYLISNPELDGKIWPLFNPVKQGGPKMPIPNDLLYQTTNKLEGVKADGTFSDPTSDAPNTVEVALGYLEGASTIAPIDIPLSGSIDPNSVKDKQFIAPNTPNPEQNVFLLELAYPGGDPISSTSLYVKDGLEDSAYLDGIQANELTPDESEARISRSTGLPETSSVEIPVPAIAAGADPVDYRAEVLSLDGGTDNVLRITPLSPLKPGTRYLVVLTDSIKAADGNPIIKDPLFESVADPTAVLGNPSSLAPLRNAALGWQALAEGYFDAATNQVRKAQSLEPLDRTNIALTYSFTTGGTSEVLDYIANPASFFSENARLSARQDAIYKLVTGQLNFNASEILTAYEEGSVAEADRCLNTALWGTLTDSDSDAYIDILDPESPNYDSSIHYFAQLPNNSLKATAQSAAAQIAELIENEDVNSEDVPPGIYECGDGITFAQFGDATEAALADSVGTPQPTAQVTDFYATNNPVNAASLGFPNTTDLHFGRIELPYYLTPVTEASDLEETMESNTQIGKALDNTQDNDPDTTPPTDKVTYRYPFPGGSAPSTKVNVPLLVQTPEGAGTAGSGGDLPVVIYQHGIFGDRTNSLALGNQLAAAGYAVLAIDLPYHGVAPLLADGDPNPLVGLSVDYSADTADNVPAFKAIPGFEDLQERHFGFSRNDEHAVIPLQYGDNPQGYSGANYLNLANLPVIRDASRQAVIDLMNLNASIATIDFDGDEEPDLDPSKVYFVGHSLGGIVGASFVNVNNFAAANDTNSELNPIRAVALVTTGGGLPRLLENSATFSEEILQALSKKNVTQGSLSLEIFLSVAQATIDSTDPLNHASRLVDMGIPTYINEIFGDSSNTATQDQRIPPAADTLYAGDYTKPLGLAKPAPLAGTEPLIDLLEAAPYSASGAVSENAAVRFTTGNHTNIITRSPIEVFTEMSTNISSFFDSDGSTISFANLGVTVDGDPTATPQ